MSLFVLDTDTLTLWLRGQTRVCDRIAATDPAGLVTLRMKFQAAS
jgi:hypothetical protein